MPAANSDRALGRRVQLDRSGTGQGRPQVLLPLGHWLTLALLKKGTVRRDLDELGFEVGLTRETSVAPPSQAER